MTLPVALTGTPGTGKSSVAARLPSRVRALELNRLAFLLGASRRRGGTEEVDLARVARALRGRDPPPCDLVVGYLSHRLGLPNVIVLRCHPLELRRRLAATQRGTSAERFENFEAEATDVLLMEALRSGRRVWEIDTTGRSVESVARKVAVRLRDRGPSAYGAVDWLADPTVTAHLLDRPR
jgi:adenylate kinase